MDNLSCCETTTKRICAKVDSNESQEGVDSSEIQKSDLPGDTDSVLDEEHKCDSSVTKLPDYVIIFTQDDYIITLLDTSTTDLSSTLPPDVPSPIPSYTTSPFPPTTLSSIRSQIRSSS